MRRLTLRNFNGIGDLLFITPSLPLIRSLDPDLHIHVNTMHPQLLEGNPFVGSVGNKREGLYLSYPDPWSGVAPTKHHILSVKDCISNHYHLLIPNPELKPLLYLNPLYPESEDILVQTIHKRQWGAKKVWPKFDLLSRKSGFRALRLVSDERELVRRIMAAPAIVCSEGGLSHIAKAVGTPAVVVYGGWAKPEWNGYMDQVNITNALKCSPCYNKFPCERSMVCMSQIPLEKVMNEALALARRP